MSLNKQAIRQITAVMVQAVTAVYPNTCDLCGPRLADEDGDCPNPNCPLKSTPVASAPEE